MKYLILSFALLAPLAFAGGNNNTGGDSCRGNCPQGGGGSTDVRQGQQQGQIQGQQQGQIQGQAQIGINDNENTNRNTNLQDQRLDNDVSSNSVSDSFSTSQSRSDSDSYSSATGGNSTATGGQSDSSSSAVAGDSSATGGGGGDSSTSIDIEGDDYPASSAMSAIAGYCQLAATGQAVGGGASIVVSDPICKHFEVANRMLLAWDQERIVCEAQGKACDGTQVQWYWDAYTSNLKSAVRIMDQTSVTGQISATAGQLVMPAALLWLLFLL